MSEIYGTSKKAGIQAVRQRMLDSILVLFAVCMIIYFSFVSPYFLSVRNFRECQKSCVFGSPCFPR